MNRIDIKALRGPITVNHSQLYDLYHEEEDTIQVQPAEPGIVAVFACLRSSQEGFKNIYVKPIRFWIIVQNRYQGEIMELKISALDDEYKLTHANPDLIDYAPFDEVLENQSLYEEKAREIL